MPILQVFLFGSVRVTHAGRQSPVKMTPTSQALLAYLLLQRHQAHPRELLATVFWGDKSQKQARRCLNTALWRLRHVLESQGIPWGTYLLSPSIDEIGFNCASKYWLDVAVFEEQIRPILAKPIQTMVASDAETLKQTLQLYTGDLLEAFYDDWALFEREHLRRLYLNGRAHLMHYYKHQGDFEASRACAQKILDQDPLREEIHREMMRLYLASGQRTLAVRQYRTCSQILDVELGVSPMQETQMLYRQILQETPEPAEGRSGSITISDLNGYEQALHQFRLSLYGFDKAVRQLRQAMKHIEGSQEQ